MSDLEELKAIWEELKVAKKALEAQMAQVARDLRGMESNRGLGSGMKMHFPIVRDFNCMVSGHLAPGDREAIFGNEPVEFFDRATIFDILVAAGCFPSKNEARKNWRGIQTLPEGYTELGPIGKQKLHIFIWNPSE